MAVLHPTAQEFDTVLKENKTVLVDFWATWCMPCTMMAPLVEQLAEEYDGRVTVAKVDIDEQQELARKYNIQSIPTLMLFKNGEAAAMEIGVRPIEALKSMIDSQL